MNRNKVFLKVFFSSFGPILLLIGLVNLAIDPLEYFGMPRIKHFNAIKSSKNDRVRLAKAQEIIEQKPKAIILGSSRVMAGFDPKDLEEITGEKAYNAGVTGANFEEVYEYFLHALHVQPELKTVVLGLDAFCFSVFEKIKDDLPDFLHGEKPYWLEKLKGLFSLSILLCSYATLKDNYWGDPREGLLKGGLFDPICAVDKGSNPILEQGDLTYLQKLHEVGPYRGFKVNQERIEKFRSLVKICHQKNIQLKVFFNPAQAPYFEALYQHGYWEAFEGLKRALANIYPIYDFTGFNEITVQLKKCPENPLFYECSHFRPLLGKVILNVLFDKSSFPISVGNLLTPESIDNILSRERINRNFWAEAHPEIVAELSKDIIKKDS